MLWKTRVKNKINQSRAAIFFIGKHSHESEAIGFEIKQAKKKAKYIYCIKLDETAQLHAELNRGTGLVAADQYYRVMSIENLVDAINKFEFGQYEVKNSSATVSDNERILFEQYKSFVKSSEDLVERRHKISTFHNTINTLIVTTYAAYIALDVNDKYKLIAGLLLPFIGLILCWIWYGLLTSYGELNSSKFKIISAIEKDLPLTLYDVEWSALCDKLKRKKYVSFTDREKRVPIVMSILFIVMIVISVIMFGIEPVVTP